MTALESLRANVEALTAYLTLWAQRDDSKAQPHIRRAANGAVEAVDAALRDLSTIRTRLVDEIREHDDIAAARVDTLLAETRGIRYERDDEPAGPLPPRGTVTFGEITDEGGAR